MLIAAMIAMLLAQDAPPYHVGNGVSQPTLIHKVQPEYSEEARAARLEGMVELRIVVGVDGSPAELKISQSLGLGLDDQAIEAVRQWQFQPGSKEGAPVPVVAYVQINFQLDNSPWSLTKMLYDALPDVANPRVAHAEYPERGPVTGGSIQVTFMIDEHGVPGKIESTSTIPPQLMEALPKWRFNPAMKDGESIPVRANFEFLGRAIL